MIGKILKKVVMIGLLACGCAPFVPAQNACAPAPVGLVSWWTADGNAADARTRNDGALTGTTFVAGQNGQAFRFAPNDNFTANGSNSLNIVGDKITIEAWIKLENNALHPAQDFSGYIGKHNFPQENFVLLFESGLIGNNPSNPQLAANQWQVEYIFTNNSGTRVHNQQTGVVVTVDGNYHHFAVTYDGAASPADNVKIYIDGVPQTTNIPLNAQLGGNLLASPAIPFSIKTLSSATAVSIDETSVYDRVLSATEITQIAAAGTAGKCKPTATVTPGGLVGWWAGDGNANDISGNNLHGALNGNAFAVARVGQGFDLNDLNGITVPDNPALNQQNFTLEAWVTALPFTCAGCGQFIAAKSGVGFTGYELATLREGSGGSGGAVRFTIQGLSGADLIDDNSIADGNFHHVAATYEGATMKIYVDGALSAQKPQTGTVLYEPNSGFVIGSRQNSGATQFYNGLIDEVSFYNRALTPAEITSVFNAGLAGKLKIAATDLGFGSKKLTHPGFAIQNPKSSVLVGDALVTFASVTSAGETQEIPLDASVLPVLPAGFTSTGLFYDVVTSAGFSGNPTVCFNLPSLPPAQFAGLRVLHLEAGVWRDRTAAEKAFPELCTIGLNSLSPFAIAAATPTAANVSVGGYVADAAGFPIRGAQVLMTDTNGLTRSLRTNSFGFYKFDNVRTGEAYFFSVTAKGQRFQAQLVEVVDTIGNLDFTALP